MNIPFKKTYSATITSVLILLLATFFGCSSTNVKTQKSPNLLSATLSMTDLAEQPAKLVSGHYEGDHLSVRVLKSAENDFNHDGLIDGALILWVNSGGSGNFRTLALIQNNGDNLVQSDEAFIGDRIKIVDLKITGDMITVNYLDRKPSDPYSQEPNIRKQLRYSVSNMKMKLLPPVQP